MGVCRVVFIWIRRNMIRFFSRVMVYMFRNIIKSSVWSWGLLVRFKSLNLIFWFRFVFFIFF